MKGTAETVTQTVRQRDSVTVLRIMLRKTAPKIQNDTEGIQYTSSRFHKRHPRHIVAKPNSTNI